MKWYDLKYKKKEHKEGDTRIVRKFLFLPTTFNHETRWLEFADILEEYYNEKVQQYYGIYTTVGKWKAIGFLDGITEQRYNTMRKNKKMEDELFQ